MNYIDKLIKYDILGRDSDSIKHSLVNRLVYTTGKDNFTATPRDWLHTIAYVVRDRLMERWMETMRSYYQQDSKRIYYLSLEFLMGRTLTNTLLNMELYDTCRKTMGEFGLDLEELCHLEPDAALGNGGLGRLAACFLDSMATLGIPGYGYGIRYEYGMFRQGIENGFQVEYPDNWLRYQNPWEFPRPEVLYPVKFFGKVVEFTERGKKQFHWVDTEVVMAMAYDTPIPGFQLKSVNNMRLWSAKSSRDFDLEHFNQGNYIKAVEDKNNSENISKVLYPDDTTDEGKELRLKQQYFFVSASLQDILRRFLKFHDNFSDLPNKVAVQLNDTHPSIAIPELMRLLIDEHHLSWDSAWKITVNTFGYTNHTLLPEALETWPVSLMEQMLPRHMQIIYRINHKLMVDVKHRYPGDNERMARLSIIEEGHEKRVRMAHIAYVGSHKINGVAEIHTQLMRQTLFHEFDELYPNRIINITNGITPRRWLNQANPLLADLISQSIGQEWIEDLRHLKKLELLEDEQSLQYEIRDIKLKNKERVAHLVQKQLGIKLNVYSLFDVHIKRIHEYKRQLLNLLHVISLYNRIRHGGEAHIVPRTIIIAGKAAPGYAQAKLIIKLIHDVADIINNDPAVGDMLKLVFLPNYNVSLAEEIIPACDLSQQISTAGTEASGTGNMKFALNGAVTIGTLDGANIEIKQEVGENNIFIFGHTAKQIMELRQHYSPHQYYEEDPDLAKVLDMIKAGYFNPEQPELYQGLVESLLQHDQYFLLADYAMYIETQKRVEQAYLEPKQWLHMSIRNIANMGKFSSDRTIMQYARQVWQVQAI